MFTIVRVWLPIACMSLGVRGVHAKDYEHQAQYYNTSSACDADTSVTTVISSISTASTHSNAASSVATYTVLPPPISSSTSSTTHYSTVNYTTTAISVSTTTASTTATYYTTEISTSIGTITVPTTITPPPTTTTATSTLVTVIDTCKKSCSIAAGTVEVFFWPTNNDYSYPATYVDTALDYTFTSPSVYFMINTIYGTNSQGATVSPTASNPIWAFDLDEVSTFVPPANVATRQLSLSDLGTDCPHTADPSAIATMTNDGRCNPWLVAPEKIKSWAGPCAACGPFGLFDPPYAIPTVTGGLVQTTTTVATTAASSATTVITATVAPSTATSTTAAAETSETTVIPSTTVVASATAAASEVITLGPSGIVIVKYVSGTAITSIIPTAASTVTYAGETLTVGGEAATLASIVIDVSSSTAEESSATATGKSTTSTTSGTPAITSASTTSSSDPTAPVMAFAARTGAEITSLILSVLVALYLL